VSRSKKKEPSTHTRTARSADAAATVDDARIRRFGALLRAWYRRNARDLPWRRTSDPYRILVSELMLQQTQVPRVIPRWAEFLERFPTLHHVAVAEVHEVEDAWAGLGYYARARNLHRTARLVTRDGADPAATLPADVEALRVLPGLGRYTAGAVSSFAYRRRAPLVDTNVERVLRRVFLPTAAPRAGATERAMWTLAERTLPRAGDAVWTHNQALMELGALVCTARIARCDVCPVRAVCATGGPVAGPRETRGAPETRGARGAREKTRAMAVASDGGAVNHGLRPRRTGARRDSARPAGDVVSSPARGGTAGLTAKRTRKGLVADGPASATARPGRSRPGRSRP
jgi:A/G-specific adenine glycosylase